MYFISVTRLRVRSLIYLPRFFSANEASVRAIKRVEGFLAGKELIDKNLTFWTATLWQSADAMKNFRNNDPHKNAMRRLPDWCSEAAYVHWEQPEDMLPDWLTIHRKLLAEGKITKVRHPSSRQNEMKYPQPKWRKIERPI